MKKLFCLALVTILMIVGLCGCGGSDLYATVTFENGSVETLDVSELPDLCSENSVAFNQKYAGQKIEVVDKISDIGNGWGTYGFIMISTENGWSISLKSDNTVIADLREGDTVKIVGKLTTNSVTITQATVTIID